MDTNVSFEILRDDSRGLLLKNLGHPLHRRTFRVWNRIATKMSWNHIFDIGSNYGEMIFFSDIKPSQRITVIEANPRLIPILRHNLRQYSNISILSNAISSQRGIVNFEVNNFHTGKSAISSKKSGIEVEGISLEDVLEKERHNSALIKIDIEGGEIDLIDSILKFKTSKFIFFIESQSFSSEVFEELLHGFRVFCIDSDIRPIFEVTKENSSNFNNSIRKGRNSILVPNSLVNEIQKITIRPLFVFFRECLGSLIYRLR